MLPKELRLAKKRDFNLLLNHGIWYKSQYFTVKVLDLAKSKQLFPKNEDPDKYQKQLKLAISVGLKFSKKAVERNRMKRLTTEALNPLLAKNALRDGNFLLLVPMVSAKEKTLAEISQDIVLLLQRAKVFKP